MIFVELSDDKEYLEVNFKPVKFHLNRIKEVMGAKFHPDEKLWTIPIECFEDFEDAFKGEIIWVTPRHVILDEPAPPPPAFWSQIKSSPVPGLKAPMYPFQVFGANFLAHTASQHGIAVLGDYMGLGKTVQTIGATELLRSQGKVKRTLVVCLSPLKTQWKVDGIEKFTNSSAMVITGTPAARQKQYADIQNYDYVITSYELILKDLKLIEQMQASGHFDFDMIILDEAHKLKNRSGKMNQAMKKLNSTYKLLSTGTPVMNKPEELYGLLEAVNMAEKNFGKFTAFAKEYMNYQYNGRFQDLVGYRNLDKLRYKFSEIFLRRTDREVEMDLPDIVEVDEYVDPTKFQLKLDDLLKQDQEAASNRVASLQKQGIDPEELKKIQGAAQGAMNLRIGLMDSPELMTISKSESVRDKYGDLVLNDKEGLKSPKLERLLDIVEEIIDSGEKVVIFTQFSRMVRLIMREIRARGINTKLVSYTGGMDSESRDKKIKAFRELKDFKVLIATEAASTGLNLQFARYLINYDLPWSPAVWEQRKGRIRRLGSQHTKVKVINLMVRGSIDEVMYDTLKKKQNVFNALIENDSRQSKRLSKLSNRQAE